MLYLIILTWILGSTTPLFLNLFLYEDIINKVLTSISNINEYLLLIDNQYFLKIKDVDSFITMGFFYPEVFRKEGILRYKPYTNERFTLTIQNKDRVFPYSELHRFFSKKELRIKKINDLLTI